MTIPGTTAATITPAMAGADLREALTSLLDRLDSADNLAELDKIREELSAASRRFGTRVRALVKKAAPRPAPERTEAAEATAKPAAPTEQSKPEPQQERPPEPPPEAPETPPEPPPRPRWPERLNTALLAAVALVVAFLLAGRAACSFIVRTVRPVGRRVVSLARTVGRIVRRSP